MEGSDDPGFWANIEDRDGDGRLPHCWQCCETLPDGEAVTRGEHIYCRPCAHELCEEEETKC